MHPVLLILTADRNILIDCGIRVNQRGSDALPDLNLLKGLGPKLDAIFISHAHADHIGALPLVHQMFPATPIYSTAPTAYFSHIMLMNAFRVMETNNETLFKQETVELATQQMHQSLLNTETWYPSVGRLAGEIHFTLDTSSGRSQSF